MRAGLLREFVEFLELREEKSNSGFSKKEYTSSLKTRCSRRKLSASMGDGINANEEFISNTVVIQVRYNSLINENNRIKYNGKMYSIILLDRQLQDNSYLITMSKINE